MEEKLFNQRQLHSQSCVSTPTIHKLLFAEDCELNATREWDMQRSMDLFDVASNNFGLRINTEKTMVMHQPPPSNTYNAACTNVHGTLLKFLDTFTYLGSNLP
ncbi:unnamed protein product [Schistocephalus solidus]|uniref:Reverse transcriptase domain-containing protein n=1 Tax=Schistocephalus solidus TaxID=70667 RepID=A0A183STU7_SCHSO|nr:unnamed protein product [Schistocephalus solidus]